MKLLASFSDIFCKFLRGTWSLYNFPCQRPAHENQIFAAYNYPRMLGFTCSQSNIYVLACYVSEQSSVESR